ncbi:MAG: two-component sensor histidine kinase BarA [Colwellia sp.]
MHKFSLKDWVIFLTIMPTTLIVFGLAGYFSYTRYVELDEFLNLRAKSIIEPIAIASKDPLIARDREKLRQLIGYAHRSQSNIIKSIVVFTVDNQVFVTSVYHGDTNTMRLKSNDEILSYTNSEVVGDYVIFRSPIIEENSNNLLNGLSTAPFKKQPLQSDTYNSISNINNTAAVAIGYIAMQIDKNKIKFNQQSQILIAFTMALLGSLLSALFALKLISNVTKPVTSMVNAVDRIREGKLESRVSGQLIGELNFLKNGINAMAQSLGGYQHEMQGSIDQATIDLRESLEQFEIQNVELSIAKRKAQEANKIKSDFLANMSHELRTPLNGVIGFTRQVLKTPLSDIQRDYLQTIDRSANNLLAIINDILDFSKLDAGKMVIENIPFSLRESLEDTLVLLAPIAHEKNIELAFNIDHQLPDSLLGDAMRIKQIMSNLVSNALKFTQQGSVSIDVTSEKVSQKSINLKIVVTDTGIGMNSEQQQTIFEAFAQADQSITRLYGGTGLGLVICQRLAHEMQGDIGFVSASNQGSTFWFTFQCAINHLPLIATLESTPLKNKTILYFEEHQYSRTATNKILESWNMKVTSVNSEIDLAQALKLAKAENIRFDYALIGHNKTATALSELKKLMNQIKPYASAVHIAINSNSPSLQDALLASGAMSCLSKPLTATRLNSVLQSQLHRGNSLQHAHASKKKIPIKVLAVDDNEANLKLINALLLEQVDEVILAENGMEALTLCKNETFALIFMDIQMPVMDGISTLKAIKIDTVNQSTPIIAVTAHALSGEKEKMQQQGFNAYMTKPIDETMLSHIIYEYCDIEHFISPDQVAPSSVIAVSQKPLLLNPLNTVMSSLTSSVSNAAQPNAVVDWSLSLKRAGNKPELAVEMLTGLLDSLPKNQQEITEALAGQDTKTLKRLLHKLNGACCYTGTPNLGKITHQLESQLKLGKSIEELEPEFFEFFEQVEQVLISAPKVLKKVVKVKI